MSRPDSWQPQDSPPWSANTKALFGLVSIFLGGLIIWRFQSLIAPIVIALIAAYILHPVISILESRTGMGRGAAVLTVFGIVLLGLVMLGLFLGLAIAEQVQTLSTILPDLVARAAEQIQALPEVIRTPELSLGPYQIRAYEIDIREALNLLDLRPEVLVRQAIDLAGSLFSQGGTLASLLGRGALSALGALSTTLLVIIVAVYLAIDIPNMGRIIGDFAQAPGYRKDAEVLVAEIARIWNAYLRGQVLLGVVIFGVVSAGLGLLRVNNALALGTLSGVLEFLPVLGPIIGAGAAVLVAFFQESSLFGLSSLNYALLVAGVMVLIQQLENNILVPRIVGDALDLHPITVMISVVMGASLAGILGAVLAAPVVATAKLVGGYGWRKMLDLPPFDPEQPEGAPPGPGMAERIMRNGAKLRDWLSARFGPKSEE